MHLSDLIERLEDAGVELSLDPGGGLRFRPTRGAPPAELRVALMRRKAEIARRLAERAGGGVAAAVAAPPAGALAPLLEPIALGSLELAHRMVLSPMEVDLNDESGAPTAATLDYYAERAAGGASLVVVEASCVDAPAGRLSPAQLLLDRDAALPGLERLAARIHRAGARWRTKVAIQLQHAGRKTSAALTGVRPVAPSAVANHLGETPRELSADEIGEIVERFAAAAGRAQLAGFDAVEIHAAHGYLVSQFLSPTYNLRDDEYGGSVEGRARFLLDIVAAIRRRVGTAFPILCRMSALEITADGAVAPLAGGLSVDDALRTARLLERAGVAAVDLSATLVGQPAVHPMAWPESELLAAAARVKSALSIPVSVTSRVALDDAAAAIARGELDLVRLGRALLADPKLPAKLIAGRAGEVRPCIYCNLCLDPGERRPAARCAVNPRMGREGELADPETTRAATPRTLVVAGGGPAGLEAARAAALRGHRVHLFERSPRLGGQLAWRSKSGAALATWESLAAHLAGRVEALAESGALTLHRARGFDLEALEEIGPDAVILATGARPVAPGFARGADGAIGAAAALEALAAGRPPAGPAAVVGGGVVGCETALRLAEAGVETTLVSRRRELAAGAPAEHRLWLRRALEERGVRLLVPAEARAFDEGVLELSTPGGGETLAVATLVVAAGAAPRDELEPALVARLGAARVTRVGDAAAPRDLAAALDEGLRAALAL